MEKKNEDLDPWKDHDEIIRLFFPRSELKKIWEEDVNRGAVRDEETALNPKRS